MIPPYSQAPPRSSEPDLAAETARHRHDLVNALTAVEGAGSILATENLSAEDRATIARLLGSGIDRLRSLFASGGYDDHAGPVSPAPADGVGTIGISLPATADDRG